MGHYRGALAPRYGCSWLQGIGMTLHHVLKRTKTCCFLPHMVWELYWISGAHKHVYFSTIPIPSTSQEQWRTMEKVQEGLQVLVDHS